MAWGERKMAGSAAERGGAKGSLSEKERIESDISQFQENVKEVKETQDNRDVLDLARRYCDDTKYFLEKKDYVTAFGCINYAHGLIDAYRKKWRE